MSVGILPFPNPIDDMATDVVATVLFGAIYITWLLLPPHPPFPGEH
jgi:hypothetical protein